MKQLHTQHLLATLVTVALALTHMTAQTMHRTGQLEGYSAIREDGQRAARELGTAVEIYDWEGDSILAQINGPRMDGQIDALTFAGKKLYAVCSDGRETFELYALDETTLRWYREPLTIDDLWHPQDETRDVWCQYLAEANCLMIQVRTGYSPDWGKATVRRCIVDLTRHLIRAGSNEGFPTFSRSPDGSYYHFGSTYLASRDSSANVELCVEVQTVDAATLRVMATDTMHPKQREEWFDASPVSLGCRQIVAYGSGISRPHADVHAQTAIDRSMALVCIARPSTIVCVDYDYQIHIRTYGVGIVDTIVDDFIHGGQPAKRATYDRASETVLIYCFDHVCNGCWPIVFRYKVESTGDKPDVVVALRSADSTKVLDSIGVQVLPFTKSEPEQMRAVFADSIYDCTNGAFKVHGTSVGTKPYVITTTIGGESIPWHNSAMAARFFMPAAFRSYASVSTSYVTDIALAPNGTFLGIGSIRSAHVYSLSKLTTTSLGSPLWATASPGAFCFASIGGTTHTILASYPDADRSQSSYHSLNVSEIDLSNSSERSLCSTSTHEIPFSDLRWLCQVPIPRYHVATGLLTVHESGYRTNNGTPQWQDRGCLHRWSCSEGPLHVVQERPLTPSMAGVGSLLAVADMADTLLVVRTATANYVVNSNSGQQYMTMPDSVLGTAGRSRMPDPYRIITPTKYWSWDGKWLLVRSFPFSAGYYVFDLDDEYICILRSDTIAIGFIVSLRTGETVEVFGDGGCIPVCGRYDPYRGVIYIGDRCGNIGVVVPRTPLHRRTPELQDTSVTIPRSDDPLADTGMLVRPLVRIGDDVRFTCQAEVIGGQVYNSAGQVCLEQRIRWHGDKSCSISTSGLAPGMYVAIIRSINGSVRSRTFAVQ